jgi:hypothetical protein
VKIKGFGNPPSTQPTNSFSVRLLDANNYLVNDYLRPIVIQMATPGPLLQYSVIHASNLALDVTTITI